MLTYHPEDHGGGAGALGVGGHAGVVARILEAYVTEAEGQDFVVATIMEVRVFRECELRADGAEVSQGRVGIRELWAQRFSLRITVRPACARARGCAPNLSLFICQMGLPGARWPRGRSDK